MVKVTINGVEQRGELHLKQLSTGASLSIEDNKMEPVPAMTASGASKVAGGEANKNPDDPRK